jgi:tetratricopeptide (TPR) repeat protein
MRTFSLLIVFALSVILMVNCGPQKPSGPTPQQLKEMADEAYRKAEQFFAQGDLESLNRAADEYGKVLKIYPSLSAVHMKRGETFKKLSYYDNAVKEFNEALKSDPNCGKCYYFLAHLTLSMAKPESARVAQDKALKDLKEAEKILPKDAEINMGMSDVFASMALYERMQAGSRNTQVKEFEDLSFQQAETAIGKDSTTVEAYRAMGEIFEMRNQKGTAIEYYKKYIELLPEENESRRDMEIHIDEMLGKR